MDVFENLLIYVRLNFTFFCQIFVLKYDNYKIERLKTVFLAEGAVYYKGLSVNKTHPSEIIRSLLIFVHKKRVVIKGNIKE